MDLGYISGRVPARQRPVDFVCFVIFVVQRELPLSWTAATVVLPHHAAGG